MCCLKGVNSKQIPGAKFCFLTLIPNIIEEEDLSYFFCSALWGPRELFLDESLVKYIYSQDKSPFTHGEARLFPHSVMIWQYSHPTLQLPAPTFPGCPISKAGSPNSPATVSLPYVALLHGVDLKAWVNGQSNPSHLPPLSEVVVTELLKARMSSSCNRA